MVLVAGAGTITGTVVLVYGTVVLVWGTVVVVFAGFVVFVVVVVAGFDI